MNDTEHTPGQLARIREYEASTDEELVAFYESAQTLGEWEANHSSYRVCQTGERLADAMRRLVGVDAAEWPVTLSGNHAKHIFRNHGANGEHDQSLADPAHVGRLAFVFANFDEAGLLYGQNGKPVVSFEYRNADGKPAPMVNVRMRIDGLVAIQQAVPDSKAHCIHIVSMRIQK